MGAWIVKRNGQEYVYFNKSGKTYYFAHFCEVAKMVFKGDRRLAAKIAKSGISREEANGIAKAIRAVVRRRLSGEGAGALALCARNRISTGIKSLDELLDGGVKAGAITEIIGEAGAGKTVLAAQLAAMALLPDGNGKVIFVDTRKNFDRRVELIARMALARGLNPDQVLGNIHYAKVYSTKEQIKLVKSIKKEAKGMGVRLLIIDSLTDWFRFEYWKSWAKRQRVLDKHMADLAQIAVAYDIPVVVTNGIIRGRAALYRRPRLWIDGAPAIPAGGRAVGRWVAYRVWLKKGRENVRIAGIFDSPYHPEREAVFRITDEGIVDV